MYVRLIQKGMMCKLEWYTTNVYLVHCKNFLLEAFEWCDSFFCKFVKYYFKTSARNSLHSVKTLGVQFLFNYFCY